MLNSLVRIGLQNNEGYGALANVLEKEILHHDILTVMSEHQLFTHLTFIGGTALRLCYSSARLSEDLDFAASADFDVASMQGFSSEIERYLNKKYQLNVKVKEPRVSESDTSTWKISIEKASDRPDIPTQKIHVDICSVPSLHPEYMAIKNHYGLPVNTDALLIPVQTRQEILADKFIALGFRNRVKPRDLWDILWLKQQGIVVDVQDVIAKLSLRSKTLESFELKVHRACADLETDIRKTEFNNEMARFVPSEIAARTVDNPNYWPYLKKEINGDVESLIRKINMPNGASEFDMGM